MNALSWVEATAVAAVVWRHRPRSARTAPSPIALLRRLGEALTSVVPGLSATRPTVAGAAVVSGVLGTLLVGPVAAVLCLLVLVAAARRASTSRRRAQDESFDDLAPIVELTRVGLSAGLNVRDAVARAQRHAPGGRDLGLAVAMTAVERGRRFEEAVTEWADVVGPPADEVALLWCAAERTGVAIADGLERLSVDLRRRRRRRAEERARRLPVTMLVPLVCCVLPAFALVTVVPLVAVGIGRLGGGP